MQSWSSLKKVFYFFFFEHKKFFVHPSLATGLTHYKNIYI